MDTLFSIHQIEAQPLGMVGEQAYHLSLMAQKGYPVIPTVVIIATRFRNFLETIHWLQPLFADLPSSSLRLNLKDSQQLQSIARQIRQTIQHAELPEAWLTELQSAIAQFPVLSNPPAVILRPSIFIQDFEATTDELSRLLEPQICWTDQQSLGAGLKALWAELFRARNLVYWQSAKLELHQIQFAVMMQPIGDAIASGSLQPHSMNWELTATRGLETAIARGEASPEIYQIQGDQMRLQQAGRQTVSYQIQAGKEEPLARLTIHEAASILQPPQQFALLSLAQTLHTPAVLEWQFYPSQLYITQVHDRDPIVNQLPSPQPAENTLSSGLAAAPGVAIAPAYVLTDLQLPEFSLPEGSILVTPMILPSWVPCLKSAAAIVSEQGGMTSHGAILARELGIPAVVGATDATQRIHTGDLILVNGDTGGVERATQPQAVTKPISSRSRWNLNATSLMLNLSQTDSIERAIDLEIDGVGLLRSELLLGGKLDAQLSDQIQHFARSFAPRPVFYRSLDLRSHEFQSAAEVNPMLGMHGTLSYLQNSESFDFELAALKQAVDAGCSNLRLILPFVRTVEEFIFCRRRIEQAGLFDLPTWIMAEVPSVLFLLPDYVRAGVQGICIGTSDLTQLMLAVDRDHSAMAKSFDESHPAVLAAIAQLIQTAHQLNIPCTISTQAALTPKFVDCLIESGIDAISVNLSAVETANREIARAEQRLMLRKIRDRKSI